MNTKPSPNALRCAVAIQDEVDYRQGRMPPQEVIARLIEEHTHVEELSEQLTHALTWLNNIVDTTPLATSDRIFDAMPNNFGGRVSMSEVLAKYRKGR